MKCQCIVKFNEPLEVREWDLVEPKDAEVMLRVQAAGVCHSDVHIWEGSYDLGEGEKISFADRGMKLPVVLGHETVGQVYRAGSNAGPLKKNHNYLVYPWIGCGQCDACAKGDENYCPTPRYLGVQMRGGYANYMLVPNSKYLIDIGDLDPAQTAPYACSGLTTYSALKKIGVDRYKASPLVIMGAGGLGLMALELIKALGGVGAIVVDIDPVKREAAMNAGALAAIDGAATDAAAQITHIAKGRPIRGVLDTVGAPQTLTLGINVLEKGGKLVMVGLFGGATCISNALIPLKALSIVGSYVGNLEELKELMALVSKGEVRPIPVIRRALGEAADALNQLAKGKVIGRQVLVPDSSDL